MDNSSSPSAAITMIAAMITPALLILGSASLVALTGDAMPWLPVSLAIFGTLLLLGGGAWMVAESRLAGDQIQDEIRQASKRLEEKTP